ncbi:MAG: GNAT family N-acetyltransferase [Deltaproteobacteria bacterium]|nr:GNAT family N-acetyltransferase [Deltaproteobacteria bacterium]
MARFFSLEYAEHATLRDGTPVVLRLVTPEDKELLLTGFEGLSQESRYARFLGSKTALSPDELRYLTELDHETHFAIGAITEPDATGAVRGLGVARFIRLADPQVAEAAIAVTDDMQGKGLGKLLFLRLVAAAAERGVATFHCEILGSNASMRELIRTISPDAVIESGGGLMSIDLPVPNVQPTQASSEPLAENPMYGLFKLVASNAIEWTAAVRNLWRRGSRSDGDA